MKRYPIILIIVIIFIFSYACSEPCLDLANRICDCEPTAKRRSLCKNTFVKNNPVSISEEDEKRCDKLLETCNCEALKEKNYSACGLSKSPIEEGE